MIIRNSATRMSDDDWAIFMRAIVKMKANIVNPGAPPRERVSVFDQFDAVHVAIRQVRTPDGGTTNMGHVSAGFGPWHREFLLRFEQALRAEEPDAFIPYWDWTDRSGTATALFTEERLGARDGPLTTGYLGFSAPGSGINPTPRPGWWPENLVGWRIPEPLQFGYGPALWRRADSRPLATPDHIAVILDAESYEGGSSENWTEPDTGNVVSLDGGFRKRLEGGQGGVPRTHNYGHGWLGGQMGDPATSPLDPIFFLHHANVDRLWALWQADGHAGFNHYPAQGFDQGHNLEDPMWPWVGGDSRYESLTSAPGVPTAPHGGGPQRTPAHVIDIPSLGYTYDDIPFAGV